MHGGSLESTREVSEFFFFFLQSYNNKAAFVIVVKFNLHV